MRWLGASWTLKFIGVRMRCYNNYTGCLSIIALTSYLRSLRSLLPPIYHQFTPQLVSRPITAIPYAPLSRYLPARCSQDKDSLWFARAFCVAAPTFFNSLPQANRLTDNIFISCRLLKTLYFYSAFDQHKRHYPRLRFSDVQDTILKIVSLSWRWKILSYLSISRYF